jgi:hypothetical protein
MAWAHLLMLANHKPSYIRYKGRRVEISRGQVGMSKPELMKAWKWKSIGKVRRFLKELEHDKQIRLSFSNITTIITILNYEKHQIPSGFQPIKKEKIIISKIKKNLPKNGNKKNRQTVGQKSTSNKRLTGSYKGGAGNGGRADVIADGTALDTEKTTIRKKNGRALLKNKSSKTVGHKKDISNSLSNINKNTKKTNGRAVNTGKKTTNGRASGRASGRAGEPLTKKSKEVLNNNKETPKSPFQGTGMEKKSRKEQEKERQECCPELMQFWVAGNPGWRAAEKLDFRPIFKIAEFISGQEGFNGSVKQNLPQIGEILTPISRVVADDPFFSEKPLSVISNHIQTFYNKLGYGHTKNNAGNSGKKSGGNSSGKSRGNAIANWGY